MSDGSEPIEDDEILYRRIPASAGFYDPSLGTYVSPLAFRPAAVDTTGLSLSRAKYKTIQQAARGRKGKSYYVAVLCAGELRRAGMEVVPRPLFDDPGHCEIVQLTFNDRRAMPFAEWQVLLAERLCLRVEGPFPQHVNVENPR